jgi:hypothetical protein
MDPSGRRASVTDSSLPDGNGSDRSAMRTRARHRTRPSAWVRLTLLLTCGSDLMLTRAGTTFLSTAAGAIIQE